MNLRSKSKFLSLILRHNPKVINAEMDQNGWVSCQQILDNTYNTKSQLTMSDLRTIVADDDKNRYSFNEDETKIRANQGHSMVVDLQLKTAIPPKTLYHGTKEHTFHEHIVNDGLKPMARQHVHLSEDLETAFGVGKRRKGSMIILHIDTEKMVEDGIEFYKSVNGVWLTNSVKPQYIKQLAHLAG